MNPWCISIDSQVQKLKCILRSTIDGLFIHYSLKHTEMTDQVSVRKLNRGDVCMLACSYDGILKNLRPIVKMLLFCIVFYTNYITEIRRKDETKKTKKTK